MDTLDDTNTLLNKEQESEEHSINLKESMFFSCFVVGFSLLV